MNFKKMSIILSAVLVFAMLAGCSTSGEGGTSKKEITLAYVAWDSEIASTHVLKEVFEQKLGYKVNLLQVDAGPMWSGVSDGSADAMVAAWLPTTHESYAADYKGKYEDLGPNLNGTKLGLVVPSYMDVNSIADLNDAVGETLNYRITGIEGGAGLMMATEKVMTEYGLDGKWNLLESSSAAMTQELQKAYDNKEPIIVTGWTPHWKFAKMDLKYLEDPKNVYGQDEQIHTVVRLDLQKDDPDAFALLDKFNWTPDDMAAVMIQIVEGASPEDAAKAWVETNADKVDAWLK